MNTKITDIAGQEALIQEYDLGRERSEETQYYIGQYEVSMHASNGRLKRVDNYKLHLMVEPGDRSAGEADKYTCVRFSVQMNGGPEVTIPSLAGWTYDFSMEMFTDEGVDAQGLMWGIPHEKFEGLRDSAGENVSIEAQYQVYSAFTYFHSWCNGLGEKDVQDLKKVGDKTVTDDSAIESPVDLGATFLDGSVFKHGVSTRDFKGLSIVDGATCALVSFDERGGGYVMLMQPMPLLRVKTVGGTYYGGDLYIDLESLWVKKVTVSVTDITTTTMFGIPVAIAVLVTTQTIKSVSKAEFDQD